MSDIAPTPVSVKGKLAPSLEAIVQTLIECLSDGSKIPIRRARLSYIFESKSILKDAGVGKDCWRDATEWFDWHCGKGTTLSPQNRFATLAKFPAPPVWNRKKRSTDAALTRALNHSRTVYGLADHVFAAILERCQQDKKLGPYMKAQRCFFMGKGGVVTGLVLNEWVQRSKLTKAEKEKHHAKIQQLFGTGDNDAAFYIDPDLDEHEFNALVARFAQICQRTMNRYQQDAAWVGSIRAEVPSLVEFDDEDCSGKVEVKVELVSQTQNLKIVDGVVKPGRIIESPVRVSDNLRIGGFALPPSDAQCRFRLLRMKLLFHVRKPDEKEYTAAAEIFDVGIPLFRDHELVSNFQKLKTNSTTVPFGFPSRKRRRRRRTVKSLNRLHPLRRFEFCLALLATGLLFFWIFF